MHNPVKEIILGIIVIIVFIGLGLIASMQSVTYSGTLPCADCIGIKTTLTLYGNQTYTLESLYIDRGQPFTQKGTWERVQKNNMDILELHTTSLPSYYQIVTDTTIKMLDSNAKPIIAPFNETLTKEKS